MKYAVQQRQLRAQHEDSVYCSKQFALLKEFSVKYRDAVTFLSEDDKAVIPIGEPNKPIASVNRSHNRSLTATSESTLLALDHDFHICGFVPSVIFDIHIPENPKDSFYQGLPHIILKDKIFQPSSALRHATETLQLLRRNHSEGQEENLDGKCEHPILV